MKNHKCPRCGKILEYTKEFFNIDKRGYVTLPCINCKKELNKSNNNKCKLCGVLISNNSTWCRRCTRKANPTKYWLGKKLYPHMIKALSESSKRLKGRKRPPEVGKKTGDAQRGEKSHLWKGGITPINKVIRMSPEMKHWRISVFERDNYTCVLCKQKGRKLNADHIKPFAYFPELRFAIDNGRTLCVECHKKTDSYGWNLWHKNRSLKHKKITKKRLFIRAEKICG